MHKFLILLSLCLMGFGCTKNESELREIPANLEIDLDQDGIVDFEIVYEQLSVVAPVDPDPGSYELIRGKLVSLNNNQILQNEEADSFLFLNDTNLIQSDTNPPLFWEVNTDGNSSIIVSISQDIFAKTWSEEWRVNNDEVKNSYLIGFKLQDNSNNLGFIELSIDNQTGQIEIVNIEFI